MNVWGAFQESLMACDAYHVTAASHMSILSQLRPMGRVEGLQAYMWLPSWI